MSKDVYKYFIDLENSKCQKISNFILRNDKDFSNEEDLLFKNQTANILNIPFYLKQVGELSEILQPIASSQLYKHCGLVTPPIFITNDYDEFYQTTQNIASLPIDTIIASNVTNSPQYNIHNKMSKMNFHCEWIEKWKFIKEYKHLFLEFMTPDCFDKFISMFLIDELRTDQDCHDDNYFLYKNPNSDKYEGIIRIDLDNDFITYNYGGELCSSDDFNHFLDNPYSSYDPFINRDWKSYIDRHNDLRELLEEDVLSNGNIVALHNALEFDLPQAIKIAGKKYNLSEDEINKIYTPISMLWEYNRNNLGRDLEI